MKKCDNNPQHNGSVKNIPRIEEPSGSKEDFDSCPQTTESNKPEKTESSPQITDELQVKPYLGASSVDLSHGEDRYKLLTYPCGKWWLTQFTWILIWPIHLVFHFTIPDCDKPKLKNWFALTFIMCIIWIGSLSYLVAWFITVVGAFQKTVKDPFK